MPRLNSNSSLQIDDLQGDFDEMQGDEQAAPGGKLSALNSLDEALPTRGAGSRPRLAGMCGTESKGLRIAGKVSRASGRRLPAADV